MRNFLTGLWEAARKEDDYSFADVKSFLEDFGPNSWVYRPELRGANSRIFTREKEYGDSELMKVFPKVAITKPIKREVFRREVVAYMKCQEYSLSGFPIYTLEGTVMGRFFLVLPYIEGDNLEQALWKEDFSPKDVEEYLPKLARDVGGAHLVELVHRDLKPANIVVGSDGLYIVDLGLMISSVRGRDSFFTRNLLVGTPSNMAPEQIKREPVSPRSDVYSLGTVLYHIYAGRNPFRENSTFDPRKILRRQLYGKMEPLADVCDVSVEMNDLVMKCLEIEPSKRPADGLTLSRALEEVL